MVVSRKSSGDADDMDLKSAVAALEAPSAKKCRVINSMEKKGFAAINAYLKDHPAEILYCKEWMLSGETRKHLQSPAARSSAQDASAVTVFHHTYSTFRMLPKYWIAAWLVTKRNLDAQKVDRVDLHNGQLRCVFTFITGIAENTFWPQPLHHVCVLEPFLEHMVEIFGAKRAAMLQKHINAAGSVDWNACGPFQFHWSSVDKPKRYLTHVTHRYSELKVAITEVRLGTEFKLLCPWDDAQAQLSKGFGPFAPVVSEFFDGDLKWRQATSKANLIESSKVFGKQHMNNMTNAKSSEPILKAAAQARREKVKEDAKKEGSAEEAEDRALLGLSSWVVACWHRCTC